MPPLLALRGLTVRFRLGDGGMAQAVRGIDLDLAKGETLGVVGESGSGKSQAAMAVMGLIAANGEVSGSARLDGTELVGMGPRRLNALRGVRMGMIFQEPMSSLDPLFTIGRQIALPLVAHARMSRRQARSRALDLLHLVGIRDARARLGAYPHELSGGQRQRVMIAMALANEPDLLIADEPTTALDVTVQAQVLDLLADLKSRLGMAMLFITHDLGIVRRIAERTIVMRDGRVVEEGPTASLFSAPREAYTAALVAAEPKGRKAPPREGAPVVLEARDVAVSYPSRAGLLPWRRPPPLRAVEGVDLVLRAGETVGIVGESGSGKSSLGRALLRLEPAASGAIRLEDRDLAPLSRAALRPLRRRMQPVFQDPNSSLSPRMSAGEIVTEGLAVHEPGLTRAQRDARAEEAFEEVRLDPALRRRYPHEFSGGQRQRLAIARAMILKPRFVLLDEPTSALDRTVQSEIVDLLRRLQAEHDLAYAFVSHDLAVVRALADRILVMQGGRVVEAGTTEAIMERPREEYTRRLIAAAALAPGPA